MPASSPYVPGRDLPPAGVEYEPGTLAGHLKFVIATSTDTAAARRELAAIVRQLPHLELPEPGTARRER